MKGSGNVSREKWIENRPYITSLHSASQKRISYFKILHSVPQIHGNFRYFARVAIFQNDFPIVKKHATMIKVSLQTHCALHKNIPLSLF